MTKVAESATTVQFDATLRTLAARATERYAGEAGRIEKALVIALNHGVTLLPDGTALVTSQSDPEVVYEVRNGQCDCPDFSRAPDGRCKHRFSVCFVKKALKSDANAPRYFATYYAPDGEAHQGVATATGHGWLFVADDGLEPLFASTHALALGGNVALYEAQRAADGDLVRKVCGYGR